MFPEMSPMLRPQFPKRGNCPRPKRLLLQWMTALALDLAGFFLADWCGLFAISTPLTPSLTSTTATLSLPSPSPSPLSALRLLLVTLADCAMRTSARAQINFNLFIPFEIKGANGRVRRRRRRRIKEASQVAVWVANCQGSECDLQMWNSPLDEILTRLKAGWRSAPLESTV